MALRLVASVAGTAGVYALYRILKALYKERTSPWRILRGPPSKHWFYGNFKEYIEDEDPGLERRWLEQYGRTCKIHLFFNKTSLFTTDTKAIQHFLTKTDIYQKHQGTRFSLGRVVGPGILVVEDDVHKQQRKIMNPAFGAPQVRALTGIFVDKSIQLRDIWAAQVAKSDGVARLEVLSWLSKATLDIIGLAGFNYKIDALGTDEATAPSNELVQAFEAVFDTGFTVPRFLQMEFPLLRGIPLKGDKPIIEARATMMRIGRRLLAESKREVAENGTFETSTRPARDLLTLLVAANTSKDIPVTQRLSDEDVIAQVPTFLVAGHETSSTAVTWALFAFTQNLTAQTRLREELLAVSTDRPTMDELNALPYLDSIVRETLRLYSPVPATTRTALRDDVVPLSTPITDINGKVHETIRMRKGETFLIPITALNRDVEIWGSDALEFRPERWDSPPPGAAAIPGIWGHMLTFLGGPRGCIGYRFALVEIKALLFTLVRAFEFELAVPLAEIGKKGTAIVTRPIVLTDPAAGNQLPLLVRPVVNTA
ncbi:cytochrome P450 [Mycena galopus ATCC 62051]|nr:cytochrome P450 [Mycena galopus ATCC 62051]